MDENLKKHKVNEEEVKKAIDTIGGLYLLNGEDLQKLMDTLSESQKHLLEANGRISELHSRIQKVEKYMKTDGSLDWRKIYRVNDTHSNTKNNEEHNELPYDNGMRLDQYADVNKKYEESLTPEFIKDVESQVLEWLEEETMEESFTFDLKYEDENGDEVDRFETIRAGRPWYIKFTKSLIMFDDCANGASAYWIARSHSWPNIISSKKAFSLLSNRNNLHRINRINPWGLETLEKILETGF